MTPLPKRPDLRRIGESAFTEVLQALLRLSSTIEDPPTCTESCGTAALISSSVLLSGPKVSGCVRIHLPKAFASHAAFLLTGLDGRAAEAEGLLHDTAGELANMAAGQVAACLAKDGYSCHLSTPSVSHNSHLPAENQTAVEHGRANVICEGHRLAVEIQCRYAAP